MVVSFLKKRLDRERGSVGDGEKEAAFPFCYVNSVFAPGLDEGVGGLWRVSALYMAFLFCSRSLGQWEKKGASEG